MQKRILFSLFCLILLNHCTGQQQQKNMNPLLCNPDSGVCEIPAVPVKEQPQVTENQTAAVQITYFTDPICSSCWAIEPQLRKLKLEYGHIVHIDYRMGGLLPSWSVYNSGGISKPSDVAHHWDEVSIHYDMPIDGDVWLEDPLPSSYPPSIAFRAAAIQDKGKALLFLRKIREMVFLEKKNITKWEHLSAAAQFVGIDTAQLKTDISGAGKTAFEADLATARQMGVRGFPTIFIKNKDGEQTMLYGSRPYAQLESAIRLLAPDAVKVEYKKEGLALFEKYPTLTAREFAELAGQERKAAEKWLEEQVSQQQLKVMRTKNGTLYLL